MINYLRHITVCAKLSQFKKVANYYQNITLQFTVYLTPLFIMINKVFFKNYQEQNIIFIRYIMQSPSS